MILTDYPFLEPFLKEVPLTLRPLAIEYWQLYLSTLQEQQESFLQHEKFIATATQVWVASEYVRFKCIKNPSLLTELFASNDILRAYSEQDFREKLLAALNNVNSIEQLGRILREQRSREMVRIIWRDLAGWAPLVETMRDLTHMADVYVNTALKYLYQWQCEAEGIPYDQKARPQSLYVIAVGKLGGRELNLSSDIDLIFTYPEAGEIQQANKTISHDVFFTRLGQQLIKVLDDRTADGFVFRVDMRLRPFGESGPLVMSFAALEAYYQQQGREWERYALVKARVITGEKKKAAILDTLITSFVYRRYIDFGVIDALRQMKQLINREIQIKNLQHNIKRGPGGIREVEFIAQAFQLIRGGQDIRLQQQSLLIALTVIKSRGHLPAEIINQLHDAYCFLRNVEHRLQAFSDQQTQDLPSDNKDRARLAFSMHFTSWEEFSNSLSEHMQCVALHFDKMISNTPEQEIDPAQKHAIAQLTTVWSGELAEQEALNILSMNGYKKVNDAWQLLKALHESSRRRLLSGKGETRFNQLMPLLILEAGQTAHPAVTLTRIVNFIEAIMRRSAYFALLLENPKALAQLVKLCSASSWIAEQLTLHPVLLDELLDNRQLFVPLTREQLQKGLADLLAAIPETDLELQMDALRRFKHAQVLRIAATDVVKTLPAVQVSQQLSDVADTLLFQVQKIAWFYMRERNPKLQHQIELENFAIIAYGKLGSRELSYGSDLDLVFLHAPNNSKQAYAENYYSAELYVRLAQRIIHIVNTSTAAGMLYEIDTRLRPSGDSGLLVNSISSFAEYQLTTAWTWEHQALVRARILTTDQALSAQFNVVRKKILLQERNIQELHKRVGNMREQMVSASKKNPAGLFDLKQGSGGITDIEFIVQYNVLRWARDYPELLEFTNNIDLLKLFAEYKLMSEAEVNDLIAAYEIFLSTTHRLALQNQGGLIDDKELIEYRNAVVAIWQKIWKENV